jgi:TolB-like protein/class 3 adenylate cyclase/Tfp pilus assembly protein PilF
MRRLAAIMFTDIAGYSALSQKNEALALELLEEHRKILRPFFIKHEGKEIETAGDSFFVEFNSAVEAANCAIEIQSALHERNKMKPADHGIFVRIGIHIGDVVHMEDNHVHGDGVNIAARVQPLAKPGQICVTEDVARQIRNKIEYSLKKLGKHKLKNISLPYDLYCIALPWLTPEKRSAKILSGKLLVYFVAALVIGAVAMLFQFISTAQEDPTDDTQFRLAVLPLTNISANEEDEYFADGMTEELISNLSKIGGLRVIARSSVMKYKNVTKDIRQIGEELMVSSILEGSVRKVNDKARITVQLVNVSTQEPVWSMDYDRELKDIFSIQIEIARSVANELKVIMASSEKKQLEKELTEDMNAFQEYLIGRYFLNTKTSDGIRMAIQHFERSVDHDSTFALAYANLAYCYTLLGVAGFGGTPEEMPNKKAREAVMRALEIDNELAEAHAALAYMKFRIDWDWKGADDEFQKAIALKPGYSTAHEWYGLYLMIQLRMDEAIRELKIAHELDPLSPGINTGLGRLYSYLNHPEQAQLQFKKALELDANYAEAHFAAGMDYYKTRQYDKAEEVLTKAVELSRRRPVVVAFLATVYIHQNKMDEARKLLSELEQEPVNNDKLYGVSMIRQALGQEDESMDILEKLYEERYGLLIFMNSERVLYREGLYHGKNNQRLLKILEKMGFDKSSIDEPSVVHP